MRLWSVLFPLLFNVYSEYIFRKALEDMNAGIIVNIPSLINIRYTDDKIMMVDILESQQIISTENGYKNAIKTKYLVISKSQFPHEYLFIKQQQIISRYTYQGTVRNDQQNHL